MITQYGARGLLGLLVKKTGPWCTEDSYNNGINQKIPSLYLALSTTTPYADGTNATEPTATTYTRKLLNRDDLASIVAIEDGATTSNTTTIYYAETYNTQTGEVEDWGVVTHACIYDAATGGNLIMYQELPSPIHPGADNTATVPLIRAGDLKIEISNPDPKTTE